MPTINKEKEIELSSGRMVTVQIEVEGIYDANYGADADGNRGVGRWLIDSHSYEIDQEDELTNDEEAELDTVIEELVYEGEWDFDDADDPNEDPEDIF